MAAVSPFDVGVRPSLYHVLRWAGLVSIFHRVSWRAPSALFPLCCRRSSPVVIVLPTVIVSFLRNIFAKDSYLVFQGVPLSREPFLSPHSLFLSRALVFPSLCFFFFCFFSPQLAFLLAFFAAKSIHASRDSRMCRFVCWIPFGGPSVSSGFFQA